MIISEDVEELAKEIKEEYSVSVTVRVE